ncbi:MAG: hypothetical protein ABGY71_13785 [bacterium]|nr:hypothetical protein [Planctomycetota bacterium]HIL52272.1 hypothetical protein [Planctomycetota bacterium]
MRGLILALVLLAGCHSLGPPPPALRGQLAAEHKGGLRRTGRVAISSSWLSGEFRTVSVTRLGPDPAVRLQLFPDFGGKLLDLVARPEGVCAIWSHNGETTHKREGLIGFLSVSLLENARALTFDRLCAGRRTKSGFRVEVTPASSKIDLHLEAELNAEGTLVARHYSLGSVEWKESFEPQHSFSATAFEWTFHEETAEAMGAPADDLFELPACHEEAP